MTKTISKYKQNKFLSNYSDRKFFLPCSVIKSNIAFFILTYTPRTIMVTKYHFGSTSTSVQPRGGGELKGQTH